MPHPKHRRTSSDKRRRASHFSLKKAILGVCKTCKSPVQPHRACRECGTYAGRQVVDVSRSIARAVKKTQSAAPSQTAGEKSATEDKKQSEKNEGAKE